jgi:hypothetical protein
MSANPSLIASGNGTFYPAPFANEIFGVGRPGIEFHLDNVRTATGK